MMNFSITADERNLIVTALSLLADEYRTLANSSVSRYLVNGFEQDANKLDSIRREAETLKETLSAETLTAEALTLWNAGRKIDSIRLVRANTTFNLKDAKQYCEKLAGESL
jgi:ribosomal protein L7/L12